MMNDSGASGVILNGTIEKSSGIIGIKSDWLPMLHELASQVPALAPFLEDYLQIKLVIDANFVHRELQWRLKNRNKPSARTRLHESADAGVLILFAPVHLSQEIVKHLGDIAERSGTTVEQAQAEWEAFRSKLHFYTPQSLTLKRGIAVVDPDDLPYIAACNELGADAVYSKDKHLRQMKAPVISIAIDASLQTYARARSIRLAVLVGSVFSVTLSIEAIKAAVGLIAKSFRAFQKLHPVFQVAIIAGLVFVFVDPTMRAKFRDVWKKISRVAQPVLGAVTLVAKDFEIASVNVEAAKKEINAVMPRVQRRSALAHARAICLVHNKALSLGDLKARLEEQGYVTKSKDFAAYLKRVLRSSGQVVEGSNGWTLQDEMATQTAKAAHR
jgi:predicted nucleic acid-binding protein